MTPCFDWGFGSVTIYPKLMVDDIRLMDGIWFRVEVLCLDHLVYMWNFSGYYVYRLVLLLMTSDTFCLSGKVHSLFWYTSRKFISISKRVKLTYLFSLIVWNISSSYIIGFAFSVIFIFNIVKNLHCRLRNIFNIFLNLHINGNLKFLEHEYFQ